MKKFPVGKVGVGVTAIYFIGLGIAMHCFGLKKFESYNEFGDFLAGAFSPVAFLWLVLGFFQQQKELQQNTDALKLQAQELQNSVEQYKAMVAVAQKQLDTELTKAQQEGMLRELDTRPSLALKNLKFVDFYGGNVVFDAQVLSNGRHALKVTIEFLEGFGSYTIFEFPVITSDMTLGRNPIYHSDLPPRVVVIISYESIGGKKYKYQYVYYDLRDGNYNRVDHMEVDLGENFPW